MAIDNLDSTLTAIKVAIVTACGVLASFLGWRLIMLLIWIFLMGIDYASGTWAARLTGTWKSEMAREGIGHKGGMVLVVAVCAITDFIMLLISQNLTHDILPFEWPMAIFPIVTMWYIITEIGSIIENAIKMGAPIPAWLPKLLDATLKQMDAAGDAAVGSQIENE